MTNDQRPTRKSDIADGSARTTSNRRFEDLPPPARRALREAEERRAAKTGEKADKPREVGGRGGEDPARYGDWEVKGIAVDF